MRKFIYDFMALCMGAAVGSCTKDDGAGNGETVDASRLVGTWAVLDEAGTKTSQIYIIGKDMTLRRYNAVDNGGYGFSDGEVSASLEDFEPDAYVYDVSDDGAVSVGGIDSGMRLSLMSDGVLVMESEDGRREAHRVTDFLGKPAPSIIGKWEEVRTYNYYEDGTIEYDMPSGNIFYEFRETELTYTFFEDGWHQEIWQCTAEGDMMTFYDNGEASYNKIIELTETTLLFAGDYMEGDPYETRFELKRLPDDAEIYPGE